MGLLGREAEAQNLCKGLAPGGTMRSAIILGEKGIGKSALLEETAHQLVEKESFLLWLSPKSKQEFSPAGWVSQIARDLRAGSSVPPQCHQ